MRLGITSRSERKEEKKIKVSLVEATEERLLNWERVYAALWTFPIFLQARKVAQCVWKSI